MDKALRRSMSESLDAAGKTCPDPSLLAAYFDRELSSKEAAHWEAHFSVCARCQEQLAILARTEPAVAEARVAGERAGWRQVWRLRWLAPLATAAAAVTLWVVIRPEPPTIPAAPATVASRQVAPATEPPAAAKPAAEADTVAKVPKAERANLADKRSVPEKAAAAPTTVQQVTRAPQVEIASAEKKDAESLAAQAPADAASRDRAQAVVLAEAAQDEMKAQRRADAAAAPAEGTRSKMAAAELQKAAPPAATEKGRESRPQAEAVGMMALRAPQGVAVSPEGNVVWRFGPKGLIEKSTDAGKTWNRQKSPVTVDLVTGSPPSEKVCWAVGASGTVLRTTDGELWEKLASPTTENLIFVTARDALNASITSNSGKTFVTTDGGKTWREK